MLTSSTRNTELQVPTRPSGRRQHATCKPRDASKPPGVANQACKAYHDETFGYRAPRPFTIPDYTPSQLLNRTTNAPLLRYVDSVRTHGHRAASIDPLDLLAREEVAALDPTRYGLVDAEREYDVDGIVWGMGGREGRGEAGRGRWRLGEIVKWMREVYVGRIAYEFMHSPSKPTRLWFGKHLESQPPSPLPRAQKLRIARLLSESEVFEGFLQTKFPNLKRYGGEGAESMIAGLDALFGGAAAAGLEHIVLCMPHRGRLALLTGLLEYSPAALFHKIKGGSEVPEELGATGDVISHLTSSPTLSYDGAPNPIKITMLPNPSHLEAVNPVAMGKARAKQFSLLHSSPEDCKLGDKVMCVQLHGDAAFTGQGVLMEGLGLSDLPHFTSGGSVHIVVNNNIGYTTPSTSARSSLYCSDIGKMIAAPILHVNGDHPEDVVRAIQTAFTYRQVFRKDIVVDLITYRRWGHNELDEPAYTQPLMYEKIRSRKSVPKLYEEKLQSEGILDTPTISSLRNSHRSALDKGLAAAEAYAPAADMLKDQWNGMVWPASEQAVHNPQTGVDEEVLKEIGRASVKAPLNFEIHPRLQRHVKQRLDSLESGNDIDFGTAEALAFGSLMVEGHNVRISGQDVGRGTFSHRHAMLVDQRTERVIVPLNAQLGERQGMLELANSSLSEYGVLGFEYGVSWDSPDLLPIWESQFGDFNNGAQIIIDTFVSSSESKWLKQSGLVMLLPHGLDGAGPEHSSARIERFLQLTNDPFDYDASATDLAHNPNMHVVNPTTAAQYFHLLRRQMKRNYRKPLIVASPKGLLRSALASSPLGDMALESTFLPVINDPATKPSAVSRVILVSGKLYYDLSKERDNRRLSETVALVRMEELSPFPFAAVADVLATYSTAEVCWAQEEPRNQGAYTHVGPRIEAVMRRFSDHSRRGGLRYIGRRESAVPAVGVARWHVRETKALLDNALAGI